MQIIKHIYLQLNFIHLVSTTTYNNICTLLRQGETIKDVLVQSTNIQSYGTNSDTRKTMTDDPKYLTIFLPQFHNLTFHYKSDIKIHI